MARPRLSIIVANFNKSAYVEATLRSALAQGADTQVVVVDDASTDDSLSIIRGMAASDPRIDVVALPENRGQSFCENRGLERVTGDYVIYLDSDDSLAEGCGARRMTIAERDPDADMWIFPMSTFTTVPEEATPAWTPRDTDHLRRVLAHRLDWQLMQTLWRTSFLRSFGAFDESFMRMTDVVLHTRAILAGARIRCYPDEAPDCFYRIDDARLTFSPERLAKRRVAAAIQYQRTFAPLVPPSYRRYLSGTLLANMYWVLHQHRLGRIDRPLARDLCRELIAACPSAAHRLVLRSFRDVNLASPIHLPGVAWLARTTMAV